MERVAIIDGIKYRWDDSPDYDDPQVQRKLDTLLEVAISIGKRKGLIHALHPWPRLETKPSDILSGKEQLRRRPHKR